MMDVQFIQIGEQCRFGHFDEWENGIKNRFRWGALNVSFCILIQLLMNLQNKIGYIYSWFQRGIGDMIRQTTLCMRNWSQGFGQVSESGSCVRYALSASGLISDLGDEYVQRLIRKTKLFLSMFQNTLGLRFCRSFGCIENGVVLLARHHI